MSDGKVDFVCNVGTPHQTSTPYVVVIEDIFDGNLIREAEETNGPKDKETLLKKNGHIGEDHEIDSEVAMKENELVLNNGRRMLIKERRQ
jgi:hypothetical protein